MQCDVIYEDKYNKAPEDVVFCPYRISPLGAHIDHQCGKINGLAIDKGIYFAYGRKMNGVIELESMNFPKRAQFHVRSIPPEKVGDWADHLRGAALMLSEKYPLNYGLSGVIEGELPIGGLSSSAAVIISFLCALCSSQDLMFRTSVHVALRKTTFSVPVRSPAFARPTIPFPCALPTAHNLTFRIRAQSTPRKTNYSAPLRAGASRGLTTTARSPPIPLEMHNRGPEIPSSVSPYVRLTFARLERLSPKAENGPEKRKNDSRTSVEIIRSASSWVDIPNAWKVGGKRLDDEGAVFRSGPPCWRPPLCCVSWTLLFSARRH